MRVPSLPIIIDEFPALAGSRSHSGSGSGSELFFLTHFHTDHMKGLSSAWTAGLIITGTITRQLLLNKFEGLRGRVLGLPFWCRTPVLSAAGAAHSETDSTTATAVPVVHVTLLPAFHIPGSAMIYIETPSGVTYLHTGDFKYTEAAAQMSSLRTFFQSHRVDHLYLDDTWLHLGHTELKSWPALTESPLVGHRGVGIANSGIRVLSKLLDADQVEEAIEAIGRRMDYQRQLHAQWVQQQSQCDSNGTAEALTPSSSSSSASAELSDARLPFIVRVYLHNQFGKELLIQQLAARLRTRALIDDARYARLLTVVEALEEERDDLEAFEGADPARLDGAAPPLSAEELAWRASGGEAARYPYDLNCFVSCSQAQQQKQQQLWARWRYDRGAMSPQQPQPPADHSVKRSCGPPLIEVVRNRASIEPATLQAASAARGGTPYYGVVISGWARLQSQTHGPAASGQVWQVPTTLHSTPQEIVDFVALLRPLSVTPLHYRPSRGEVVMQRLGPYLRVPFVNNHDTGCGATTAATAGRDAVALRGGVVRWMPYLPAYLLLSQMGGSDSRSGLGTSTLLGMLGARDAAAVCDNGLDALEEKPPRGFRIRPAGLPLPSSKAAVAASRSGGEAPGGCDSHTAAITASYFFAPSPTTTTSLPAQGMADVSGKATNPTDTSVSSRVRADGLRISTLLPSWRLSHLTQSYLSTQQSGGKRERVDVEMDGQSMVAHRAERHAATATKIESGERAAKAANDHDKDCPAVLLSSSATTGLLSLSDIADNVLA
ncbi:conserved hypothetical protein [Leishmania major strain Friedlin]|uniref:DNA repair metallo-beta-lactamase domain-containing protein n=1 Tax=Leishmania major TaxID=5664 RepID=Q4QG05_LEIMA|nr:conserved hypothetical protein [Leishmania major strain Friedlin]CAG9571157.1 hypothetical_protein_-_conserved [Leishmania major strain Friedlin]CAJ03154.1 conserved hypothetical protein [Leishmania major strain Friedlin]|eukprot:XP_001681893.1 conserved hypothetical protein [Leishmania major strain Friedlin]